MKRLLLALFAFLAVSAPARATLIKYEMSAVVDRIIITTADPVPPDANAALQALLGQSIGGTFVYDNEALPASIGSNPNIGLYNGAISDVQATLAGANVASGDVTGIAFVRNDALSPGARDSLLLSLAVQPPATIGQVSGFDIRGIGLAWTEGALQPNPLPPFLTSGSLPSALPAALSPQISFGLFVPGLSSSGTPGTNVSVMAREGAIRLAQIPEPSSLSLLVLGLVACRRSRRRVS